MGPQYYKLQFLGRPLFSISYCYWRRPDSLRRAMIAISLEVDQRAVPSCFLPSIHAVFLRIRVVLVVQIKSICVLTLACLRPGATFATVRNLLLSWLSVMVVPQSRHFRELLLISLSSYIFFSLFNPS